MELITEDKAFEPSEEHGEKIIRFDTVVSVVVGDSHPGRRIVGFRKMSLPMSFSRSPCSQDLDDPSFTPTPTRKLSLRLPSLKVLQPNAHPPSASPSDTHPLRSCLIDRTSGSHPPRRRRDSALNGPPNPNREIPESSPAPPLPSPPPVPLARITSSPTSFISSPFRRNSSSSSVAASSLYTSTVDEDHGPVESLMDCCSECLRSVELGFSSEWEDAPWSESARKKKERDEKSRAEQDAEFGVNENGTSRAVVGVGQRGGCLTPDRRCLGEDMDGKAVEGLIERVKGVLVDEVSMARRASQVLQEEEEAEGQEKTPVASRRSPFISRNPSTSPPTSPIDSKNGFFFPTSPRTTASFPNTSAPSQRPLSPKVHPTVHLPPPSSSANSASSSTVSESPVSPVWIFGEGLADATAGRALDSPTTIYPPSPLSIDDSLNTYPPTNVKSSFFPAVVSPNGTTPIPPFSPPLSTDLESVIPPSSNNTTPTKRPSFPPSTSAIPHDGLARSQTHQGTASPPLPSPSPSSAARSSSVPRRTSSADTPATTKVKLKGMWGALKGGVGMMKV